MTGATEPVEAVIISGPRKGEIIRLPDAQTAGGISEEDITMLNEALDDLAVSLERVGTEVRETILSLRQQAEDS